MSGVGKISRRRQSSGVFRQIFVVATVKILSFCLVENAAAADPVVIDTEVGFVGTAEFAKSVGGPFHTLGLRTASFALTYAEGANLRLHALLRPDATLITEKEPCRREFTGILDDPFNHQDCSEILDAYDIQWLSNNQLSVQLGVRDKFWQLSNLPLKFGLRPAVPTNAFAGSIAWSFGGTETQNDGFIETAVFSSDRHEQPASSGLNDNAPTTQDSRPGILVLSQYQSGAFSGRSILAYDALNAPREGNLNLAEGELGYRVGAQKFTADFLYQRLAFAEDLSLESLAANLSATIPFSAIQSARMILDLGTSDVFQGETTAQMRGQAVGLASVTMLRTGLTLTVQLQGETRQVKNNGNWESGFFRDVKPEKDVYRAGVDLTYNDL